MKTYCYTNQFPTLPFCGSHLKPHGPKGLGQHYHLCFDPNLGHGICEIHRILFTCVACTLMFDKHWISGIKSTKEAHYQPFTKCNYWTVLGPYNNLNIIELTPNQ